jgi:hypothetical protein
VRRWESQKVGLAAGRKGDFKFLADAFCSEFLDFPGGVGWLGFFGWQDSSRSNGSRLPGPSHSRGIADGKGDRPASRGHGFQLFAAENGLFGLIAPIGQDIFNGGAKIGQALFAGLALAVGLGEFGADGGKAGFPVHGAVMQLDG